MSSYELLSASWVKKQFKIYLFIYLFLMGDARVHTRINLSFLRLKLDYVLDSSKPGEIKWI